MLIDFFYTLRAAKLPVSVKEFLTLLDAIKADPLWNGGNYTGSPESGLRTARYLSMIAGANPVALQDQYPTRIKAEKYLAEAYEARAKGDLDANDQIYQLDSSRDYNPEPNLKAITVPVLWVNSADDFINPPELGLAQQQVKAMPRARRPIVRSMALNISQALGKAQMKAVQMPMTCTVTRVGSNRCGA